MESIEINLSIESMFSHTMKPYPSRNIIRQPTSRSTAPIAFDSSSSDK